MNLHNVNITFQMTYEVNKNGVVYSGTKNACDALEGAHGEVLDILDSVGAPRTCPVKEVSIFYDMLLI